MKSSSLFLFFSDPITWLPCLWSVSTQLSSLVVIVLPISSNWEHEMRFELNEGIYKASHSTGCPDPKLSVCDPFQLVSIVPPSTNTTKIPCICFMICTFKQLFTPFFVASLSRTAFYFILSKSLASTLFNKVRFSSRKSVKLTRALLSPLFWWCSLVLKYTLKLSDRFLLLSDVFRVLLRQSLAIWPILSKLKHPTVDFCCISDCCVDREPPFDACDKYSSFVSLKNPRDILLSLILSSMNIIAKCLQLSLSSDIELLDAIISAYS